MNKKSLLKWVLFSGILLNASVCFGLTANNGQNTNIYDGDNFKMGFGLQSAILWGETRESLYDVDVWDWSRKISELVWELDDVVMFGGVLSANIGNRIYVNLGAWSEVASSDGSMVDSDWLAYLEWTETEITTTTTYEDLDGDGNEELVTTTTTSTETYLENLKTHVSESKAELKTADMFDFNVVIPFAWLNGEQLTSMAPHKSLDSNLTFNAILGYKSDDWKWEATGGAYIYNAYFSNTYTGYFDEVPVVSYEHDLKVPYVGLSVNVNNRNFGCNTYFLYSKWAEVEATDTHHLRDLVIRQHFDDGDYWSAGINFKWNINDAWTIFGGYQKEHLKQIRGTTEWIDYSSGTTTWLPGHPGISHENDSATIGASFQFA